MGRFRFRSSVVSLSLLLGACTGVSPDGKPVSVRFEVVTQGLGKYLPGLSGTGGSTLELSSDFCYAMHVTGDEPAELRRVPPPSGVCAQAPQGLGLMKGFYEKGATIDVEVPIGSKRRFDLFAYAKSQLPLGTCVGIFEGLKDSPGSKEQFAAFQGGQKITAKPQLIASATSDISMGDNLITLVAASDTNVGVPYLCSGLPIMNMTNPLGDLISFRYAKNYGLGGTCSEEGQPVVVTAGTVTASATCSGRIWQLLMDVSAAADAEEFKISGVHRDIAGNWSNASTLTVKKDAKVTVAFDTPLAASVGAGADISNGTGVRISLRDATDVLPINDVLVGISAYTNSDCSLPGSGFLLSGSTVAVIQVSSGVASFPDLSYTQTGNIYFQATALADSTYLSSCVGPVEIYSTNVDPFLSSVSATASNVPSGSKVKLYLFPRDSYGNLITGMSSGEVSFGYANDGSATFQGDASGPVENRNSGYAQDFEGIVAGTAVTFTATARSVQIATNTLGLPIRVSVTPGNATKVVVTPVPGASNYALFPMNLVATLRDLHDNVATGSTGSVNLYLLGPDGRSVSNAWLNNTGSLGATVGSAVTLGVTTFTSLRIRDQGNFRIAGVLNSVSTSTLPFVLADTCASSVAASGSSLFHAGSGSPSDPYVICKETELVGLTVGTVAAKSWILGDDIDLGSLSWTPVGTVSAPFCGNLDGRGHRISGLLLSNSTSDNMGLFGVLGSVPTSSLGGVTVSNLYLEGATVYGRAYVGALAGKSNGLVQNVFVVGSSNVRGSCYVGGLVGTAAAGKIARTMSEAKIYASGTSGCSGNAPSAGGLVGHLGLLAAQTGVTVNVIESMAVGDVFVNSGQWAGGLVGASWPNSAVADSYALGHVSAVSANSIGGFIGAVQSGGNQGEDDALVDRCYSMGAPSSGSGSSVNGFAGDFSDSGSGMVSDVYWEVTSSGVATANAPATGVNQFSGASDFAGFNTASGGPWFVPGNTALLSWARDGFDVSRKGPFTISSDGLGLSASAGFKGKTFAKRGRKSGKLYWEVKVNAGSGRGTSFGMGVSTTRMSTVNIPGYDTESWGIMPCSSGSSSAFACTVNNGTETPTSRPTFQPDDVVGALLDMTVSPPTIQFYVQGSAAGSLISLSIGKVYYPVVGSNATSSNLNLTANFGTASFYAVPSGYIPAEADYYGP